MIEPGDTIVGLDTGGHIWVVLSQPTPGGEIAIVNLTKHGRPRYADHGRCTVVRQSEYPVLQDDSCVYLRAASMNPLQPLLSDQTAGRLPQRAPLPAATLRRVQRAVLGYRFTPDPVRDAIRATIGAGG